MNLAPNLPDFSKRSAADNYIAWYDSLRINFSANFISRSELLKYPAMYAGICFKSTHILSLLTKQTKQ